MTHSRLTGIRNLFSSVESLNQTICELPIREESFLVDDPDAISECQIKTEGCFEEAISIANDLVSKIDEMICERENLLQIKTMMPDSNVLEQQLQDFYDRKISLKEPPFPSFSGIFSYKNENVYTGQMVCIRHHDYYKLMIAIATKDSFLTAVDPFNGNSVITTTRENWTPLQTIIPLKPSKRLEHPIGSYVLSLFPRANSWSDEFYLAKVIERPWEKLQKNIQDPHGYALDFGDDKPDIIEFIPEQFTISIPPNWTQEIHHPPK